MSNEAQKILNEIQFKTGKSLEEIAREIGYSRPYLNNVKLKGDKGKIVGILKAKYYNILQNVPRAPDLQSKSKTNEEQTSAGTVPASKLIEVLEEQNAFLRRSFEASLTGLMVQSASILAHVATSLEKDDEREARGNQEKLRQLKTDTGRRIGDKLQIRENKGSKVG